ncbi:hypothetical protein GCM10010531_05830 [Blastococcus jejuensis]|uniref:Secreted protein n=1 Tax=Blastococcus jejuensis TaxID=351224 RepID=A0ABP6NTN7_9ACTN
MSVGLRGAATAGTAAPTSTVPASTAVSPVTSTVRNERPGRPAEVRREPGREVAGPEGRRCDMTCSLGKRVGRYDLRKRRSVTSSHSGNTRHTRHAVSVP